MANSKYQSKLVLQFGLNNSNFRALLGLGPFVACLLVLPPFLHDFLGCLGQGPSLFRHRADCAGWLGVVMAILVLGWPFLPSGSVACSAWGALCLLGFVRVLFVRLPVRLVVLAMSAGPSGASLRAFAGAWAGAGPGVSIGAFDGPGLAAVPALLGVSELWTMRPRSAGAGGGSVTRSWGQPSLGRQLCRVGLTLSFN